MGLSFFTPSDLLKPYVKHYLIIESNEEITNRTLPGTSLVIGFRYKGKVNALQNGEKKNLPAASVSGLRKSVRLFNYAPNTSTLLVILKENAGIALLKKPVHELFEEHTYLEHFMDRNKISDTEERLFLAENSVERIRIIEHFLLSEINLHDHDKLIQSALQHIQLSKGLIKIKELSSKLFISQDAFEKRFRKHVGNSPKQFSSLVRLNSIVKKTKSEQKLIETAYEAGYFDQAHFNKDFKLFTGQTPGDFFKNATFW